MKVLVLGAGVTGLTTAWFLHRDGHEVVVLDGNFGVALGGSQANGGQLSYSYVAPFASPAVLPAIPFWIMNRRSPLRFRPRLDPDLWQWCLAFVMACNAPRVALTTRRLLALSFYSRAVMDRLLDEEAIKFNHVRNGKLIFHSSRKSFEGAKALLEYQKQFGPEQEALDPAGCVALEPSLSHVRSRLVGGIYTPSEESGDCYRFCKALEARLRTAGGGVSFHFDCRAIGLVAHKGKIVGVETEHGVLDADTYVLALGSGSPDLLRPLGMRLPLYALKGYSLTIPLANPDLAPRTSITDYAQKVVYSRLGDRLRVAGMVDLVGREATVDGSRVLQLLSLTRATFPECEGSSYASAWCGLRPATPRSTPILGATPYANLFLNVGQGALGFTLAAGCGRIVADLVVGRPSQVPLDGMVLSHEDSR